MNKRWTTRKGHERGGKPFTKTSLYKLLTNVTYTGKITYKDEVHEGEHSAIVADDIWQRVQAAAAQRSHGRGAGPKQVRRLAQGYSAVRPCNCAMSPTHSTRKELSDIATTSAPAQKRGWDMPVEIDPGARDRTIHCRPDQDASAATLQLIAETLRADTWPDHKTNRPILSDEKNATGKATRSDHSFASLQRSSQTIERDI